MGASHSLSTHFYHALSVYVLLGLGVIAERLSARQLILHRISAIVCMYGNLIRRDRVAQQEMIMGLDMNNVMDNNWILFCIWRVQLPFLWLSSH